jgi:hypothetical protein
MSDQELANRFACETVTVLVFLGSLMAVLFVLPPGA